MVKDKINQGFTLVELMVTLAVAAIILAIAAPSFSQMIRDHRLLTVTNDFMGTLQLARSEAIRRGVQVTMLPNTDDQWQDGWNVFTDSQNDEDPSNVIDDCSNNQDCWLVQQAALNNGITITSGGNIKEGIRFFPSGAMAGVNKNFIQDIMTFCLSQSIERQITLNSSGSSRITIGNVCP